MTPKLPDPESLISEARIKLLFIHGFIGTIALDFELVEVTWCATAATDGKRLYYNRAFILQLTIPELVFLIAHEALHAAFLHLGRRGRRDKAIWNMAIDLAVNYILVHEKVGIQPKGVLYDPTYTDALSAEEIYDLLIENGVEARLPLDEHLDHEDAEEEGDNDDAEEDKASSKNTKGPPGNEGHGKAEKGKSAKENGSADGDGSGNSTKLTVLGGDGAPKLTTDDLRELQKSMVDAVARAKQFAPDKLPKSLVRMIDEIVEPKLDWKALLHAHIRSAFQQHTTYMKVSRRSWGLIQAGHMTVLPGSDVEETVDICIGIDASASITNVMVSEFLGEVRGIVQTYKECRLRVWSFDTEVHAYREFTPHTIADLDEWRPEGNGATHFEANFNFMKSRDIVPARFVMFTDGFPNGPGGWGDPDYAPTLFVIARPKGNSIITAPYGVTADFETSDPTVAHFTTG